MVSEKSALVLVSSSEIVVCRFGLIVVVRVDSVVLIVSVVLLITAPVITV